MLNLENLNRQSFYEILEDARKSIPVYAPEWTNTQPSDPGITVLEMFAWLNSVMREYMNVISPESFSMMLRLLGIESGGNCGSETIVSVQGLKKPVTIPALCRWQSGGITFENTSPAHLSAGEVLGLRLYSNGKMQQIDMDRLRLGNGIFLFDEHKKNETISGNGFEIVLSSGVQAGKTLSLYIALSDDGVERSAIIEAENFYPAAKIRCEYYGSGINGDGYYPAVIKSDETFGFLFSGMITLEMNGTMTAVDDKYLIRFTLEEEEYDFPPKAKDVCINALRLLQQKTLCKKSIISAKDIKNGKFKLDNYLALCGVNHFYIKDANGYVESSDFAVKKDTRKGVLTVSSDKSVMKKAVEGGVLVISIDNSIADRYLIGSGTGISGQKIELGYKETLSGSMELLIGEPDKTGKISFNIWEECETLSLSGKASRHFIYVEEEQSLVFGDNINGMVPPASKDSIRLLNLVTTLGEGANIKSGMINRIEDFGTDLSGAEIYHITQATGGINKTNLTALKDKAAQIFENDHRAVTMRDYEKIILKTPGLVIDKAVALIDSSGDMAEKGNRITVVVQGGGLAAEKPSAFYERNILNNINNYRLVGTKTDIIWPRKIELVIHGEIELNPYYRSSGDIIEGEIKAFIERQNSVFGKTFDFGELYGAIEMLSCVNEIVSLSVSAAGEKVSKNFFGDIVIPPNGIYYIRELRIDYTSKG